MLRLKNTVRGSAPAVLPASSSTVTSDLAAQLDKLNHLIETGKYSEAGLLASQLTQSFPNSPNSRIAAAAVDIANGDTAGALKHYRVLTAIAPLLYDGYFNQALILHEMRQSREAVRVLRRADTFAPERAAHWSDCGLLYEACGENGRAAVCYRRAIRENPLLESASTSLARLLKTAKPGNAENQLYAFSPVQPLTTIVPGSAPRGKKILIVARHQMFVAPLVESLKQHNEVILLNGDSPERLTQSLQWADLAWFDWCDDLLVFATRLPSSATIIARLHSYEVFTEYPAQVDWTKVAALVFVNHSVRELFLQQVKAPVRTEVIANGLDLTAFPFQSNKPRTKKIASVGYINYKKNPALLLHCFKAIHDYDPEYSLHIAGEHQDPRIALYMAHFLNKHQLPVTWDGWVSDMPSWYDDKSFVISTSLFESFHFSIAEGMAMGLVPLIHDWYGASNLYPGGLLFSDPQDCVRLLKEIEQSDRPQLAKAGRSHVEKHFDSRRMLGSMHALMQQLVTAKKERGTYVQASR